MLQPPVHSDPSTSPLEENSTEPAWKKRLKQLGWAGILFFTVKGILSLTIGAWLVKTCNG